MITHIDGILDEKNPAYAIIDVNGVGYMIHISLTTFSALPDKGIVRLYTHLAIREDAHTLYGFSTKSEREMFRMLISVSGVGASTARMILSSLNPSEVNEAILSSDVNLLKKVKGIGAKSAQRIIVDLQDKLGKGEISFENLGGSNNTMKNEALSALLVLGVDKKKAESTMDKVLKNANDEVTVEELIKLTLKNL